MGKRDSNIEILRIIAMVFITAHHLALWGYLQEFSGHGIQINTVWLQILESFGKIGVDLFMLITGYFSLDPKPTFKKVVQLTNKVRFYAVSVFLLLVIFGQETFGIKPIIKSLFPTVIFMYWFISIYIIIYIFSGHLARYFKQLAQSEARWFIVLNIFIFMVLPTFFFSQGSPLTDLIPVFFCGLYIRKYGVSSQFIKLLKLGTSVSIFMIVATIFASDVMGVLFSNSYLISNATRFVIQGSSPLALVVAVAIFVVMLQRKEWRNNTVNWLSSSALAIYLIQDNEFFRPVLWQNIVKVQVFAKEMNTPIFVVYTVLVVTIVVIGAILIDKLLSYVLNRPGLYFLNFEMEILNWCIRRVKKMKLISGFNQKNTK